MRTLRVRAGMPVVVVALALAACGGPAVRPDADAARGAPRGLRGEDFDVAVRDFTTKVSERHARGWPPHVAVDAEGKPVVAVSRVQNRTRDHLDGELLRGRLREALVEQGLLSVAASRDERDDTQLERERAGPSDAAADEPATGLVARGTITDEREETATTYWITLSLIDAVEGAVVVTTRTKVQRRREP